MRRVDSGRGDGGRRCCWRRRLRHDRCHGRLWVGRRSAGSECGLAGAWDCLSGQHLQREGRGLPSESCAPRVSQRRVLIFLSLDSPRGSITGEGVARRGGCAGSTKFRGLAALGMTTRSCHDGPQPGADEVVNSGQEGGGFETRPAAVSRNVRELRDGRTIGRRRGENGR